MRHIIFDLETTGFEYSDGHRIVEIGAVELLDGKLTGKEFHAYINPQRDVPEGAFNVHGLSEAFLSDKPLFTEYYGGRAFLNFIKDGILVAHNGVKFDLPFINFELKKAGLKIIKNPIIDTLPLARQKFPGAPASLDALCIKYGIDKREREKSGHGALLDSKLLAEVFNNLTGGIQSELRMDRAVEITTKRSKKAQAKQRRKKLPSLITQEELKAHKAFVAELGENALWNKIQ